MVKLVAYIRGGLGDVWPAISAIQPIIQKHNISKFDITIITDSVYYFRYNYPRSFEKFSLDMLHKLTPNVIMVPPWVNNDFKLTIDDVSNEFTQENADKNMNEFMFWRPNTLKEFVRKYIKIDTIFIDALFTECIMKWDFEKNKYERVDDKRGIFEFSPSGIEKRYLDRLFERYPKHILIHIRKKTGEYGSSPNDTSYNEIIEFCNINKIKPIVIGAEKIDLKGDFVNLIGRKPLGFEGMGYLLNECKIMLGNDSGFSSIKLYQQQKDKLLIMEHPTWKRSPWYFRAIGKSNIKSNYLLLDARENNISKIEKSIEEYYK